MEDIRGGAGVDGEKESSMISSIAAPSRKGWGWW